MKRRKNIAAVVTVLFSFVVLPAGCGSTAPARFYVLEPLERTDILSVGGLPADTIIGLGPITLPEYLDRPQIVTRSKGNMLHLSEYDRWAQPMQDDFSLVLAQNLTELLSTEQIVFYPWPQSIKIDYRIDVRVMKFEASSGTVYLDARWGVYSGEEPPAIQRSNIAQTVDGDGYGAIVRAQSKALAWLSREIASALIELAKT